MLGVSLYVLGDTMIVGRGIGAMGLTALNISIPMINVLNAFGLLFGIGGATLISTAFGEKKYRYANRVFTKTLLLAAAAGLGITLLSILFLDELAWLLGASAESFPMVTAYLRTFLLFSFPFIINSALTAIVRTDGGSKIAMAGMLSGSIFNVIFDYVFIFIFRMGMQGAALATGLAPCLGIGILSFHYILRKNRLTPAGIGVRMKNYAKIFTTGVASFILEISSGVVIFVFNFVILGLAGDAGVSSYSIVANLSLICIAIFQGLAFGMQPLISYYNGSGNAVMRTKVRQLGVRISLLLGVLFFLLGLFFPRPLAAVFITDEAIIQATIPAIRLYFTAFLMMGVNMVWTMKYQAIQNVRVSMFLSLFRGLFMITLNLFVLSGLLGMTGVWLAMTVTEIMTFFVVRYVGTRNGLWSAA